jgi:hypothetical protein
MRPLVITSDSACLPLDQRWLNYITGEGRARIRAGAARGNVLAWDQEALSAGGFKRMERQSEYCIVSL